MPEVTWQGRAVRFLGNHGIWDAPKTAVFCSGRCPGLRILEAQELAHRWRAEGRVIISGFHTPVEKEILRILLAGTQPIILCPARGLPRRLPPELSRALAAGRLLLATPCDASVSRADRRTCELRNRFVADSADSITVIHVHPGSLTERSLADYPTRPAGADTSAPSSSAK
jgi:hypothetical protein